MLQFLLNRIRNNLMLYVFLLGGCILAVAIFSAIPMYSSAILQEMLNAKMEGMSQSLQEYPHYMNVEWIDDGNQDNDIVEKVQSDINKYLIRSNKQLLIDEMTVIKSSPFRLVPREEGGYSNRSRFYYVPGLDEHVNLVRGHLPDNAGFYDGSKDYLEVLVTEEALIKLDIILGDDQEIRLIDDPFMTVKIVGVIDKKDKDDIYFNQNRFEGLKNSFIVSKEDLDFIMNNYPYINVEDIDSTYYFDYKSIKIEDVGPLLKDNEERLRWLDSQLDIFVEYDFVKIFESFKEREASLRLTLWILTIPVLLLTAFYTYMISSLIMKNDGNEIAILKSRGAGSLQIFSMYALQTLVVSLIAYLVGPLLGRYICGVIGASNGFMEFVARDSLPIVITDEARLYGLLALVMFIIFTLLPAFLASRISIVQFKRSKNENKTKSFFEKSFLDVILLAVAGYGYINMGNLSLANPAEKVNATSFDPLLFLVSTLFILGINLLFLRIYPYIVRLIFIVFKKRWNPVLYFSLLNVSRADHNLRFIMLFIMLSISFGILGSSQARTLNQNALDQVRYQNGGDVVVSPYDIKDDQESFGIYSSIEVAYEAPTGLKEVVIDDTPYEDYKSMKSAESVTKFLHVNDAYLRHGRNNIDNMEVIGLIPYEFPTTGWFRDDLFDYHLNEYMNILTQASNAVFLSKDLYDEYKIKVGDEVTLFWDDSAISAVVYGYIPNFPTYQPYVNEEDSDHELVQVHKSFALMNYQYIEGRMPLQDYDILIKKADGVTDVMVQEELTSKGLEVEQVKYTSQELIAAKNDPILQGINGVLTMCFIVTMFITVIGYLIFWIISMKGRALKFGIFRAMGMSMNQVSMIIITEQILMTGSAIGIGFGLGVLASRLFVPLLQYVGLSASSVPPFIVVLNPDDYIRTLSIAGGMLTFGLLVLFVNVRRLKMNQVIKLGED